MLKKRNKEGMILGEDYLPVNGCLEMIIHFIREFCTVEFVWIPFDDFVGHDGYEAWDPLLRETHLIE